MSKKPKQSKSKISKKPKESHELLTINWKKCVAIKKNGDKWAVGTNAQELDEDDKPNVPMLGVSAWAHVKTGTVPKLYNCKPENLKRVTQKMKKANVSQGLMDAHERDVQRIVNPPKNKAPKVRTCSAPNLFSHSEIIINT